MDLNTMKLSDIPEITELLKVLEENGLLKEQTDVKTLVSYIEDMETKLFEMSTELKEMHGEVGKIRDSTLRARCTQLITAASEKIQQASQMVVSCKDNLIKSAKNALQAFKEKGKDALITAVNAMKIPSALDMLKNGFHRAAESLGKSVSNLETVRNELHDVGTHTGIVQKVENGIVYTVEGNSGDSVRVNQYPVGHYEILGYGILCL